MRIQDKVVVVTGGASGIGTALCRRFADKGVKAVVVADIDESGAREVAWQINGLAVRCDVSKEADIIRLVRKTEETCGPVDIYCSNAGIIIKGDIEVSNAEWQKIWEINVMAHVYAARAVIPGMLERGGGGFVCMASAAGLLSQIDSALYSTTKHAALGFIENLAINYGDRGIVISAICPMAVRTRMTRHGGGVAALDGMLEPDVVADLTIKAIAEERFLVLPHPEVKKYVQHKAMDHDRWIAGMQRLKHRYVIPAQSGK